MIAKSVNGKCKHTKSQMDDFAKDKNCKISLIGNSGYHIVAEIKNDYAGLIWRLDTIKVIVRKMDKVQYILP